MKKRIIALTVALGLLFIAGSASASLLDLELINQGYDSDAAGTLSWDAVASSFSGQVVVSGLDAIAQPYQLKIEQAWDQLGGQYLSQVGRTWDNTMYAQTGDVHLSNVGDYMSYEEILALAADGHDLVGYLMFGYFTISDNAAVLTLNNPSPPTTITAANGSFTLPFFADFSWHTAGVVQEGDILMPVGSYDATFLITRESDWNNPLLANNIQFTVDSSAAPVPEPATLLLLGSGLLGLSGLRRRKIS